MPDPEITRLEQFSQDELTSYVEHRLRGLLSQPIVVWSRGDTPQQFLIDADAASTDRAFKTRLRQTVRWLLEAWSPTLGDTPEYGARLILLCGWLAVPRGVEMLDDLLARGDLERMIVDGVSLKKTAVRALLDYNGPASRPGFWEPLLEDADLFDVAFQALIAQGTQPGLEALSRYLLQAVRHGLPIGRIVFDLQTLGRCLARTHPERWGELLAALGLLPPGEKTRAAAALARLAPTAATAASARPVTESPPPYPAPTTPASDGGARYVRARYVHLDAAMGMGDPDRGRVLAGAGANGWH